MILRLVHRNLVQLHWVVCLIVVFLVATVQDQALRRYQCAASELEALPSRFVPAMPHAPVPLVSPPALAPSPRCHSDHARGAPRLPGSAGHLENVEVPRA